MKPSPLAKSYFASGFLIVIVSGILTIIDREPMLFTIGFAALGLFFAIGIGCDVYAKEKETHG